MKAKRRNKISLDFPLRTRRQIPFYHNKTEAEFRQDPYESYHHKVMRQTMLHLADELWKNYPYRPVLDWMLAQISNENSPQKIADIGCGVGRLMGELAQEYPKSECWGIDYSYQLLRQAHDYWIAGKTIEIDGTNQGFGQMSMTGKTLQNVHLALAKGEALPFSTATLDLICSSFVLDRFEQPVLALQEMYRVLDIGGKLLLVSPLNFQQARHWKQLFPIQKLLKKVEDIGFSIEKMKEDLIVKEPLDSRNNVINWQCLAMVLVKSEK